MLYTLHEMHHAAMTPVRLAAKSLQDIVTKATLADAFSLALTRRGMRVVGPNCLGIVNTTREVRLNASLAPLPPLAGRAGSCASTRPITIGTRPTGRWTPLRAWRWPVTRGSAGLPGAVLGNPLRMRRS